MDFINEIIDFLVDPNGIGFPILIGTGLGAILYLMNYATKANTKATEHAEKNKVDDRYNNKNLPYKPF